MLHRSAKGRLMPELIRLVVVKNGREWPGCQMLDPGTRIASRWYDSDRKCYVVELAVDGVPPSAEVQACASWNC
jgi:hypothetical protein